MTYSTGGLIQASDFNGFASSLNDVWGTGSGDSGWGQTAIPTVSSNGTVTATNWATLINNLSTAAGQTNTGLTVRTAPVAGNIISPFINLGTDIANVGTNRGNARFTGSSINSWSGTVSKTTSTVEGPSHNWALTWDHTITFPSANQARYFWNAGGLVQIIMSKTSTGLANDASWNSFISNMGTFYLSGRVNNASQSIGGQTFTGFTRYLGTGTPTVFNSTTGWWQLPPNIGYSLLWSIYNNAPYSLEQVIISAGIQGTSTLIRTVWQQYANFSSSYDATISGGTPTNSPFGGYGTAPTVLCTPILPDTSYLPTNSWGTPTVTASVIQSG